jgi:hypothetical protein
MLIDCFRLTMALTIKRVLIEKGFINNSLVSSVVIKHGGQFVEEKLVLSSSLGCDQIDKCQIYDLGHTLRCNLSQAYRSTNSPLDCFLEDEIEKKMETIFTKLNFL